MSKIYRAWIFALCVVAGAFGAKRVFIVIPIRRSPRFTGARRTQEKVSCADCHMDRSKSDLRALWDKVFYSITFSYKTPSGRPPTTRTCTGCTTLLTSSIS